MRRCICSVSSMILKKSMLSCGENYTATCMLMSSLCAAVYTLAVCPCDCPVFRAHVESFCFGAVPPQAEKGRICLVEAHQVCQHLPVAAQIIIILINSTVVRETIPLQLFYFLENVDQGVLPSLLHSLPLRHKEQRITGALGYCVQLLPRPEVKKKQSLLISLHCWKFSFRQSQAGA